MVFVYIILCTFLTTLGQAFWKLSLAEVGGFQLSFEFLRGLMMTRFFLLGTFGYGCATVLWLYLLSKYEFSFVCPLMSITYIYSLVLGYFIFHEPIGMMKVIGVFSIILGTVLVTK